LVLTSQLYDNDELNRFTPTMEIPLCGHATLAAAHIIFEAFSRSQQRHDAADSIQFRNPFAGRFAATRTAESCITIAFPSAPPEPVTLSDQHWALLSKAFLIIDKSSVVYTGRNSADLILELSPSTFSSIPRIVDYEAVAKLGGRGVVGYCIAESSEGDKVEPSSRGFWLRGFFPNIGIIEDHVTGSALCALAPYYDHKFRTQNSSTASTPSLSMKATQRSTRGGFSQVQLVKGRDANSADVVLITAPCVTVKASTLFV
jgi:PhzF family phenazine biosynthesis protein